MGALKALSKDGPNALFFQCQWEIIGPTVCSFVKQVFLQLDKVGKVIKTLIVLIPMVFNTKSINQFQLISLCNVIHKIITKVITLRLRSCMPFLIAPNHCNFVHGRHGINNIFIKQEVIHSMRYKKRKER